jgi:hypothetical protein
MLLMFFCCCTSKSLTAAPGVRNWEKQFVRDIFRSPREETAGRRSTALAKILSKRAKERDFLALCQRPGKPLKLQARPNELNSPAQ